MITIPELAAETLGSHLAAHMGRRFGSTDAQLVEIVQSAARLAIDCIGNSDALYHNVEHTMLVTLVGYDILKGRRLITETNASDFAHVLVACLFHDIGYVRGILQEDGADGYIIDAKGNKIELSRGSSDAALLPYHVDRSKLFVMDRFGKSKLLDATRIANAIEFTRRLQIVAVRFLQHDARPAVHILVQAARAQPLDDWLRNGSRRRYIEKMVGAGTGLVHFFKFRDEISVEVCVAGIASQVKESLFKILPLPLV